MSDPLNINLTQIWNHLATAAQHVGNAIEAESKGLPTQEHLANADDRAAQAHLALKKTLAVREADRTTK